jgi:hypothetical protein
MVSVYDPQRTFALYKLNALDRWQADIPSMTEHRQKGHKMLDSSSGTLRRRPQPGEKSACVRTVLVRAGQRYGQNR